MLSVHKASSCQWLIERKLRSVIDAAGGMQMEAQMAGKGTLRMAQITGALIPSDTQQALPLPRSDLQMCSNIICSLQSRALHQKAQQQ